MKTRISLTERIERYVDACPEAVAGNHGHAATYKVAIALIHGFNLAPETALPFLERYNQRCDPPWNDKELRHKLASAHKLTARPGKAWGYLL